MPITQELKTYLSRLTRKLILRGRSAVGFYSMEGYRNAPNEPEQTITAQRAQHYGFVSEPPEGAEVIAVAINGGASNRAAIAEYVTDTPEIGLAEVALWARYGQLVLLNDDSEISLDNGDGGSVVISGDTTTVTDDLAVVRDLAVGRDGMIERDLGSGHELGISQGTLTATPSAPVDIATVSGDDTGFILSWSATTLNPSGPTISAGMTLATVTLGRAFASLPLCIAGLTSHTWPLNSAPSVSAHASGLDEISVVWQGEELTDPITDRLITVFVRGNS